MPKERVQIQRPIGQKTSGTMYSENYVWSIIELHTLNGKEVINRNDGNRQRRQRVAKDGW